MVQINGSYEFIVYDLDTFESVINRLASELKTIPRYLYFTDGNPDMEDFYNSDGNIIVENLLNLVIGDDAGIDFINIFENVKDKIKQNGLDMFEDIFLPFIAFNKTISDAPDQVRGSYILLIQIELEKHNIFDKVPDIQYIWDNKRDEIISSINKGIIFTKNKVREQVKLLNQFYKITSIIPYSKFELEKVNFEFTLDIVHVTVMEIFNQIELNPGVPFACINNLYKILKDFVPSEEWDIYLESAIVFKVLQKKDVSNVKLTDYTDAILSVMGDPGQEIVSVGMSLLTFGQYLTRDQLIERFLNTIKGLGEINVNTIQESRVNGVFYYPKHRMNKYVFADMVMNNPVFSAMMSIDESEKASKKKESVYIHFYHPKIGNVKANITEKISEKGDPVLRGKDIKGDFELGSYFIRVKISSADNLKAVETFQEILSKFFVIYDNDYQDLVDYYRNFIPNFATLKSTSTIKPQKLKLKDIAPEVFIKGYPPKCTNHPTIIDDDEVEEAENEGKMVMRYPMDESEGFIPRNYICNYEKAKYPGLRENPLANRDIVPYLPCCYEDDHSERKGSIYRHYFFGDELRKKMHIDQQDLILTNKFASRDKYGILPEDITKLFDTLDYKEGYMYVRKGVFDTKSSFLDCVLEGMYEESNILDYDDKDEREAVLYDLREKYSNPSLAASAKQEMYDFSTEEILEMIRDPNIYLDPKLFTGMLEEVLNCNIYVFNRLGIRNGQLALPRFLQSYYKTNYRRKCIFVYEHWGSKSDHSQYPRCELIVRWHVGGGGEEDVSYYSDYGSKVAKGIRNVFNRMSKAYVLNKQLTTINFPPHIIITKNVIKYMRKGDVKHDGKIELLQQGIDSYGKCRMLSFNYKGEIGMILTTPMPPLAVPEVKGWTANKIDQELALELAADLKIIITGQSIMHDVVKELYGKLGDINISIPVNDGIPIDGVPYLDKGISYPENEISVVDNFNKYKKLARYITEYVFWLFSHYLQEDEKHEMNLDTVLKFQNDKIKIDPDFEYGEVSKIFSEKSGVMDRGKLVLKSEETLKRLMYVLRLEMRRSRQKLYEYYSRKVIENYYLDITDFDQHQFQVILQGNSSIQNWIQEQKTLYNLHDNIQIGKISPYFFQNSLIDSDIYLAQNTDNQYKAVKIVETWLKQGYNPGENPDNVDTYLPKFTLYSYVNTTDIKTYSVDGLSTDMDIRVIGYKIEDESFFTALLPLG